jgi:hypothetical protein
VISPLSFRGHQPKRSQHFWVQPPERYPTKILFTKDTLPDGTISHQQQIPSLEKSWPSAATKISLTKAHPRRYSFKATLTISKNAFRTQERSNLARDDVWRFRKTPPLVSFLVGWLSTKMAPSSGRWVNSPDDGGSKDLWNAGKVLPDYSHLLTVSHLRQKKWQCPNGRTRHSADWISDTGRPLACSSHSIIKSAICASKALASSAAGECYCFLRHSPPASPLMHWHLPAGFQYTIGRNIYRCQPRSVIPDQLDVLGPTERCKLTMPSNVKTGLLYQPAACGSCANWEVK